MTRSYRFGLAAALSALAVACGREVADGRPPDEVAIYAASSLRDVLQDLAPECEASLDVRLVFNFGASSELARQIEAGNQADVFFGADEDWMDALDAAHRLDEGSRRSLLSNRLVVVGAIDRPLELRSADDLAGGAVRRIALANPEAVPAGKYAKAWLRTVGRWEAVQDRLVPTLDVRAALAAAESGSVDAAIVYATDAAGSTRARVLFRVPDADSPHISYPIAALADRPKLEPSRRVVRWLAGPAARAAFERHGFVVPVPAG